MPQLCKDRSLAAHKGQRYASLRHTSRKLTASLHHARRAALPLAVLGRRSSSSLSAMTCLYRRLAQQAELHCVCFKTGLCLGRVQSKIVKLPRELLQAEPDLANTAICHARGSPLVFQICSWLQDSRPIHTKCTGFQLCLPQSYLTTARYLQSLVLDIQ